MAVTVEELEVIIRANIEQAMPQLQKFAKQVNEVLGKAMDEMTRQTESVAKAVVPALEKAKPAVEKTTKELAKRKKAIEDSVKAEKELWEIAKRASDKYNERLNLSDNEAPQTITVPRTKLASEIIRDRDAEETPKAIENSYVQMYRRVQKTMAATVNGVKDTLSVANNKVLELRGTLENLQAQMENQMQKYKALLAKSLQIKKTKGANSIPALTNERQMMSALAAYDRLHKRADKIREALAKAQEPVREFAAGMRAAQAPAEKTAKSIQKVAQNTQKATAETKNYERQAKKSGKSTRSVFERLGYSIQSMLTVGLLYKAVAAIRRAFTEAMENVAKGSERANATLSKLSTSLLYAKNSVAAAFMPALEALTPVIVTVADALARLFNLVGMVTARLFGNATTVLQAVKAQNNYAASLGGTGAAAKKAAKDAQQAVLSFDELNKLSEPQEDTGSGGAALPGEMWTETVIPENVLNFADRLEAKIEEVREKLRNLGLDKVVSNFQTFFEKIKKQFAQYDFATAIEDALFSGWEMAMSSIQLMQGVVLPLAVSLDIPGIVFEAINALSAAFSLVNKAVKAVTPGIVSFVENGLKPIAEWIGGKLRDGLGFLSEQFDKTGNWYSEHEEMFTQIGTLLGDITAKIWEFWEPIADTVWETFKGIISTIVDVFLNLSEKIGEFVVAMGEAWNVVYDFLDSIGVIDFLQAAFETLITNLGNAFQTIVSVIGTVIGLVIDNLKEFMNFIKAVFSGDWEAAWESVKKIFSNIWETIKGIVSKVWDSIVSGVKTFANKFKEIWNKLWKDVGNFFIGIGNGLIGAFESVVNFILRGINKLIGGINTLLSGASDLLDKIGLGFSFRVGIIPEVNLGRIPKLAQGAVLKKPTVAQIAEYAGAQSNPEIVAPQSILKETFVEAMFPAIASLSEKLDAVIQAIRENGVEISANSAGIFKTVKKEASNYQKITGTPAFA